MNANDIINHKDFKNIASSAIIKYNLLKKMKLTMDEYIQDVAAHMIIHGVSQKIKMTTNIYNHCIWVSRKRKNKKKFKFKINDSYDHDFSRIELEEIYNKRVSVLTKREKDFVDLKLKGFTNREIAKMYGCTHQNISCVLSTAKKRMTENMLNEIQ